MENQKLRAELQAAKIQLAAMEAIPHSSESVDELLATWHLEDWRNEEFGACLLDPAAAAVYQENGSHTWPRPIGALVSKGDSDSQTPYHAMTEMMNLVNNVLLTEDWTRCA